MTTFNNLTPGETLDRFEAFFVAPCRDESADPAESSIAQCLPEEKQFWSVYGVDADGAAHPVHDEDSEDAIVNALRRLIDLTGKPVLYRDPARGPTPEGTLLELADWLTMAIHDDLPALPVEDFREDDFDNHPLAGLREAVCVGSGYDGSDPPALEEMAQ